MARSFQAQVTAWARKSENRMEAAMKEATQDLTEEMLTPRAKSGRLPVDTGALRNSFVAAVNSIPRGPSDQSEVPAVAFDMQPLVLAINRAKIGDRLAIGTAMNYARAMESRYAYMRSAVQNWAGIVFKAAKRVEREVKR